MTCCYFLLYFRNQSTVWYSHPVLRQEAQKLYTDLHICERNAQGRVTLIISFDHGNYSGSAQCSPAWEKYPCRFFYSGPNSEQPTPLCSLLHTLLMCLVTMDVKAMCKYCCRYLWQRLEFPLSVLFRHVLKIAKNCHVHPSA